MATVRIDYAAIIADVEAGIPRGEIARKHKCSEGHVGKIYRAYVHAKAGDSAYLIRIRRSGKLALPDWAEQFLPEGPASALDADSSLFDWVIDMLRTQYSRALNDKYIRQPMAYALYHTWREVDGHGEKV